MSGEGTPGPGEPRGIACLLSLTTRCIQAGDTGTAPNLSLCFLIRNLGHRTHTLWEGLDRLIPAKLLEWCLEHDKHPLNANFLHSRAGRPGASVPTATGLRVLCLWWQVPLGHPGAAGREESFPKLCFPAGPARSAGAEQSQGSAVLEKRSKEETAGDSKGSSQLLRDRDRGGPHAGLPSCTV